MTPSNCTLVSLSGTINLLFSTGVSWIVAASTVSSTRFV